MITMFRHTMVKHCFGNVSVLFLQGAIRNIQQKTGNKKVNVNKK